MTPPESDEEAFAALVHDASRNLYAAALAKCGNRYLAEDLVQETWIRFWKKWWPDPSQRSRFTFKYIVTILYNVERDYRKAASRQKRPDEVFSEDPLDWVRDVVNIEGDYLFSETAREVWRAVGELSQDLQALISLVYSNGLSIRAAAAKMGWTEKRAYAYHRIALDELRRKLESRA